MADVKISGLPAATTPVAGTEVLPVVQSGTTKKVSIDNLTAGKAVSALSMTATNFKTSPATANLDISSTTIAASGSDANVDVNINAKGSGVAYLNQRWGVNQSGALVALAGNTYDIGNGTNNPRDVNIDRYAVMNGLTASKAVFTDANKNLTTTGTVAVNQGGTNASSASITAFNNITGYTASGATGTTSTNLVFSTSPTLTTPKATTTIGVGNASASASGSGITFPASQDPSTDANTLDDYEEGTYTATLTPGTSGSITVSSSFNTLNYTKIGRLVFVNGYITASSISSPTGSLALNLPFTSANTTQRSAWGVGGISIQGSASSVVNGFQIIFANNTATAQIYVATGNSLTDAAAQIQGGGNTDIRISFCFITP